MTLKPTITGAQGANTVLSSSSWNTDVIQSDNYLQEVLAGTSADKIPGSAIAPNVALAGAVVSGGLTVSSGGQTISSGGLNVNAGTTSVQALTATTGSFNSVSAATGTFSGNVSANGANVRRMTGGVSGAVTVPSNGSVAFSVTLDDAITPTRAVATVSGTGAGASTVYNAQVTALGSGTVSGVVNCNSTGGTVNVYVIAY